VLGDGRFLPCSCGPTRPQSAGLKHPRLYRGPTMLTTARGQRAPYGLGRRHFHVPAAAAESHLRTYLSGAGLPSDGRGSVASAPESKPRALGRCAPPQQPRPLKRKWALPGEYGGPDAPGPYPSVSGAKRACGGNADLFTVR
jgi:hypothetical protein